MASLRQSISVPCNTGQLTAAVNTANTQGTGTLLLAANCNYSYLTAAAPSSALPQITGNMQIYGQTGTKISRDPNASEKFRIIDVAAGATLLVTNVSIEKGNVDGDGGGILNNGTVNLAHTDIRDNVATGDGGGINNASLGATATIQSSSTVSGNIGSSGGGVANYGKASILGSAVTTNTANGGGGGIYTNENADTTISSDHVDHNFAEFAGGGVLNFGTTRLYGAVIEYNRNSATEGFPGGGIYNVTQNIPTPGVVTSANSTIRFNQPTNCYPAGTIAGCAAP